MYFVVYPSEDGARVYVHDDEESLLDYWDDALKRGSKFIDVADLKNKNESWKACDPNYWPEDSLLIIKGEVAIPKPVEVVQKFKIS